jgi:hypothetical protein
MGLSVPRGEARAGELGVDYFVAGGDDSDANVLGCLLPELA